MAADPASDRVPLAPLQEAFAQSGLSATALATRLGWMRDKCGKLRVDGTYGPSRTIGDNRQVMRKLGLRDHVSGDRRRFRATTIEYGDALAVCRALNLDPVDVGL
jgi:hypothetical protein